MTIKKTMNWEQNVKIAIDLRYFSKENNKTNMGFTCSLKGQWENKIAVGKTCSVEVFT